MWDVGMRVKCMFNRKQAVITLKQLEMGGFKGGGSFPKLANFFQCPPPPNLCKYLHIPPLSIRPLKLTNSNRPLDSISDKSFKKNRLHLTLCTRIYILFLKNIYLEMLLYRQKKMLKFAHLKNNKSRNFSRHSFSSLTIHKPWARSVQPFYANKQTSKVYIERDVCAVYCVKYI